MGINLSAYQHHIYVVPSTVSCAWVGVSTLGCATSCSSWIKADVPTSGFGMLSYSHETGHTFGMQHASTDTNNDGTQDSEYGDGSCFMGGYNFVEANAGHRDLMHWFDANPAQITQVTSSKQYVLYPLEQNIRNTNTLKVLKIKKNASSPSIYYVSYRQNAGPFGMVSTYSGKVSIHRWDSGLKTFFIQTLITGQSFTDPANGITVQAVATGRGTATVNVTVPPQE
jgi:hypothetical protein